MTPIRPAAGDSALSAPTRAREEVGSWRPLAPGRSGHGRVARAVLGPPWFPPVLFAAGAVVLWAISLPSIDLDQLTDLGLASQMPVTAFLALILLTVSFVTALHHGPLRPAILLADVLILVVMLFGVTELVQEAPRFSTTYVHAGFAEAIMRTGELRPQFDARFDWPVFFIGAAYLTSIAGFDNPIGLAPWISVILNLLYIGPLWIILRSLTTDIRMRWLGIWFFLVANWVGQDYFAPQGFNLFLYLVILAILLTWFKPTYTIPGWILALWSWTAGRLWKGPGDEPENQDQAEPASRPVAAGMEPERLARTRVAMVMLAVLLFAVVVSSHQLTPFMTLIAVTALVAFHRLSLRGLPILMGVMVATWVVFAASAYLGGHLPSLVADVGRAGAVASAGVADRLRGSDDHQLIVYLRLGFTMLIWTLAVVGALRRLRHGYLDLTAGLLAAAPFVLVVLQGYGGEMFLRVYFFGLPFMAFFLAALFRPVPLRPGRTGMVVLAVALSIVVLAFPFARYGNERQDYMTWAEIGAMEQLYAEAEPGSLIVTANYNAPIRYRDLEQHRYRVARHEALAGDIEGLLRIMRDRREGLAYLVLTRSQQATAEIFSGLPTAAWERLEADLRAHPALEVMIDSREATVFLLDEPPPAQPAGAPPLGEPPLEPLPEPEG